MKIICSEVGINLKDRNIVNHSGRTTPITHLFREGIPIVTSMSITGHKSESSYCIYSRPSEQQKKDALSTLIDVVDLPESQDNEDNDVVDDFLNNEDNDIVDDSLNKNQDPVKFLLYLFALNYI